jgi:hypothetical protein
MRTIAVVALWALSFSALGGESEEGIPDWIRPCREAAKAKKIAEPYCARLNSKLAFVVPPKNATGAGPTSKKEDFVVDVWNDLQSEDLKPKDPKDVQIFEGSTIPNIWGYKILGKIEDKKHAKEEAAKLGADAVIMENNTIKAVAWADSIAVKMDGSEVRIIVKNPVKQFVGTPKKIKEIEVYETGDAKKPEREYDVVKIWRFGEQEEKTMKKAAVERAAEIGADAVIISAMSDFLPNLKGWGPFVWAGKKNVHWGEAEIVVWKEKK